MKSKGLLLMLLMAIFVPSAMNAQGPIKSSHNNKLQAISAESQQSIEMLRNREAGWLMYDVTSIAGVWSPGLSSYTFGVMFPSSMLDDNNTLDTVSVFQYQTMTGDMIVNVYSGGDDAPGNLVHTGTVATTGENGWIDLDLSAETVNFDPERNLWITVTIEGGDEVGLVLASLSNTNDLNASWFNYAGNWYYLSELSSNFAGLGWLISAYVEHTEIACATPTNLTVSDITTSTATLSWGSIGEETAYQVVYSDDERFDPNDARPIDVRGRTYTLTNLTDDTEYYVYVRSNCGDGSYSAWSEMVSFTTPWLCDKPFNLKTSDITYNSANLRWDGWQDTYTVQYTPMNKTWEADFSNGVPEGWTLIDNDGDGNNWTAGSGYVYSASYDNNTASPLTPDNWLVTPKIAMGGKLYITAYGMDPSYPAENFAVYRSTKGGNNIEGYTQIAGNFVATGEPTVYAIDLSSYSGEAYIAIRHYNCSDNYWLVVSEMFTATAGETVTDENVASPYAMENLTEDTFYAVQVQGNCPDGDVTDWSNVHYFTSGTGNVFQTDGNWNEASNWKNNAVPAEGEDVTINANCIIPAGYTAIAENVTIGDEGSLTIKDGGQLIHGNEGVVATMEKEINGYTGDNDNYYLIASPVTHYLYNNISLTFPDEVTNLLENTYDFYQFDCTADLEWLNYRAGSFDYMVGGMGYLYANSEDVTLSFTGELHPFVSDFANGSSLLSYEATSEAFNGFNLVGNMFAADAYIVIADYNSGITGISDNVYFFTMGDGELVAGTGAVAPMQAVMVQASSDSQVALCYTQPLRSNSALNINVNNAKGLVDAAYICFNEGSELNKFQLNPNHTKLFFTKDNQDYAVVRGEAQGEMPLSFKAENNGTYTLSFSTENVEFGYLHLIDNMTGADIDLLQTPSYSFEAKTTDYASRFRLVFTADSNSSDDSFAFFSDGSLVVNNEGSATLQVIDITGRLINTETINGSASVNLNAAPGVYMLRLINGDNVKVQKVVVK